jgi:putative phosphoribosyl transferase
MWKSRAVTCTRAPSSRVVEERDEQAETATGAIAQAQRHRTSRAAEGSVRFRSIPCVFGGSAPPADAQKGDTAIRRATLRTPGSERATISVVRIVPWIPPLFRDRAAAGRALAEALSGFENAIVVGVARGGVAVAAEVARALAAPPLTAVDVERVNARGLRLGAATASAAPYLREGHGVPEDEVAAAVARARREAEVLEARLDHEQLPVAGRTALVVDDGAITGLTLAAACVWARTQNAARVVAAVPVAQVEGLKRLRQEADEVVCPHPLEQIAVVGQAYDSFDPLDEWYVAGLLSGR